MRCLDINKTSFFYANLLSTEDQTDEDGLYTGETKHNYTEPTKKEGNISPAAGVATSEIFGIDTNYTHVLVMDDPECDLDELSILWVCNTPHEGLKDVNGVLLYDSTGAKLTSSDAEIRPYDYIVRRKAVSRNYAVYALEEVRVGASQH